MPIADPLQSQNYTALKDHLQCLESYLKADVFVYVGQFSEGVEDFVKRLIEELKVDSANDTLYVILTTSGGALLPVERIVNIFRFHYKVVNFIVPNYAYSAGTVLVMSGDDIFMNYHSVLGPIDPQVQTRDGKFVAALGYLDKINQMLEKANNNTLSQAEFLILKDFDLAEIRTYEQNRDLAITILKTWLVKYKFRTWERHRSTGVEITTQEKEARAIEIAAKLSDNNRWNTHARPITRDILESELLLKIIKLEDDINLNELVNKYHDYCVSYMQFNKFTAFFHTRKFL